MLNIIICGAPGCGKGTQSELLEKKYKLMHLSTGELLRKEIDANTEIGIIADSFISKGNLVPDEMIIEMLKEKIENQPFEYNGFILDGFPRTVNQARELEKLLLVIGKETTVLIDLCVDRDELIKRLLKRGETSGRSDDNLETIQKRLEIYEQKTLPVNEFYKEIGKYTPVDGMGSLEDIFNRINEAILLKSNRIADFQY